MSKLKFIAVTLLLLSSICASAQYSDYYFNQASKPIDQTDNKFKPNWFVFASCGLHTFRGDYSSLGNFRGTISPDWSIGVGRWFIPSLALKLEFIKSDSRGYTVNEHYAIGETMSTQDGTSYQKMKTNWWDISGNVILNLSSIFLGSEIINNPTHINQFLLSAGIGGVHHISSGNNSDSRNDLSAHLELQYSHFFTPSKSFSLDFKIRNIFYQSKFDLEYGQNNHIAHKLDFNFGFDLGLTYYFNKQPNNENTQSTASYSRDYREQESLLPMETKRYVERDLNKIDYETFSFYVFFPNNGSGLNDYAGIAQQLLNPNNIEDLAIYKYNSHQALLFVSEILDYNTNDFLVSFADVFAVLTNKERLLSKSIDFSTVDRIKNIFNNGILTMIQAEVTDVSQINLQSKFSSQLSGKEQITRSSSNPTNNLIEWFKNQELFSDVPFQIYQVNSLTNNTSNLDNINDLSSLKLQDVYTNCVKINIHYLKPKNK